MRAFRIVKTNTEYKVIKAMMGISKNRKDVVKYTHVYYNASEKEIIATNGIVLLIFKTDLFENNLADPKNGEVFLEGNFLMLDETTYNPADYNKIVKSYKPYKVAETDFRGVPNPENVHRISEELASQGFCFQEKYLNHIKTIADVFSLVYIPRAMSAPVNLVGSFNNTYFDANGKKIIQPWFVSFYIMPVNEAHWQFNEVAQPTE